MYNHKKLSENDDNQYSILKLIFLLFKIPKQNKNLVFSLGEDNLL